MTPPKIGRPELPQAEKQGKITAVRLRADERDLIEAAADDRKQRLSDWMRDTLLASAKEAKPRTPPSLSNNNLNMKATPKPRTPSETQTLLGLTPVREKEINGIGMGVLGNGTAYLTGRGLAAMCGIPESTLRDMIGRWNTEQYTARGVKITNTLNDQGYLGQPLFHSIEVNGSKHRAYPDVVCMAFLEYYAFDANPPTSQALNNYRLLVRSSLKAFIYVQVGFDPTNRIPQSWKNFHDRVSLVYHKIPEGYFSVFKEMADLIVSLIQHNLPVDDKTVPDISVGITWGKYWADNKLADACGERVSYEHNYPDYFPQSKSNPQKPWAYPDAALPAFRKWMRTVYLPSKFPAYLDAQEAKRQLPPSIKSLLIAAMVPKAIET